MKDLSTLLSKLPKSTDENRIRIYENAFSVDDQTLIQNFESNTDWVLPVLSDCLLVGNMNIDKYCFYPFLELTKKYELKLGKEVRDVIEKKLDKFIKEVSKAFEDSSDEKQAVRSLTVYGIVVKLLSENILQSREIVNKLCEVPKLGFKSKNIRIKEQSFVIWKIWVDVFSKDPNWSAVTFANDQSASRRLDLILKPLMYLKFSELFPMVFETWWHVCRSLHQKLPLLFDEVVFGLIKLCVGGSPAFLAEGSGTDVILSTVNVPFTGTSSPIFVLNEKLRKIPFVLMELPKRAITKEVLDNFFDLLKCVLSDGKGISGVPTKITSLSDVSLFSHPQNILHHSVYIGQCIRWYSMHAKFDDIRLVDLGILWCKLFSWINTLTEIENRTAHLQFATSQLQTWVKETQHEPSFVYSVIKTLVDEKIFTHQNLPEEFSLCSITQVLYQKAVEQEKNLDTDCIQTLILAILNNLKHSASDLVILKRITKFVELVKLLLKDDKVDDEIFSIIWIRISNLVHTLLKNGSLTNADFLEDDLSTINYVLLLPIYIVKKSNQIDLNVRNLKPLFTVTQHLISKMPEKDFTSAGLEIIRNLESMQILELCKKDSNLLSLASEYLYHIVETFPFSEVIKNANNMEPVLSLSPLKAMPEKMRPLLAGLRTFAITVFEASTLASTDRQITQLLMSLSRITCAALNTIRSMDAIFHYFTLEEFKNPSIILAIIDLMVDPLASILEMSNDKNFNSLVRNHVNDISTLLKHIMFALKNSYHGPYDNELLGKMNRLFIVGFAHVAPKVRNPIVDLWKCTFEKSNISEISEELRKILVENGSRLGISIALLKPGALTLNLDDLASDSVPVPKTISPWLTPKTPVSFSKLSTSFGSVGKITNLSTPDNIKSTKNQQMTKSEPRKRATTVQFSEEDESQDYVPVKTPPSKKKQRLTEHQKEKLFEKKDNLPFLDEDSTQTLSKKLPEDYVLESTQFENTSSNVVPCTIQSNLSSSIEVDPVTASLEENIKKSALVEFSQDTQFSNVTEATGSTTLVNFLTPVDAKVEDDAMIIDSESVKTSKEKKKVASPIRRSLRRGSAIKTPAMHSPKVATNSEQKPSTSQRRSRKSATKLVFEEEKRADTKLYDEKLSSLNEIEELCKGKPSENRQSSVEKSSPSLEELKKLRQDFVFVLDTNDLVTPNVVKKLNMLQESTEIVPDTLETIDEVNNTGKNVNLNPNTASQPSVVTEISSSKIGTEPIEEPISESKEKPSSSEAQLIFSEQLLTESQSTTDSHSTPSRMDSNSSSSVHAGTPSGILKKFDSPSTAEKRNRRVHFETLVGNLTTIEELGSTIENSQQSTKIRSPQKAIFTPNSSSIKRPEVTEPSSSSLPITTSENSSSHVPFFPELLDCTKSISSICSKLSASGLSLSLHNLLKARKITTIGDFAKLSEEEIATLPIKNPKILRARSALSQFLESPARTTNSLDRVLPQMLQRNSEIPKSLEDKENVAEILTCEQEDSKAAELENENQILETMIDEILETPIKAVEVMETPTEDGKNLESAQEEVKLSETPPEATKIVKTPNEEIQNLDVAQGNALIMDTSAEKAPTPQPIDAETKALQPESNKLLELETQSPFDTIDTICYSFISRLKESPTDRDNRQTAHQIVAHLLKQAAMLNEELLKNL